MKIALLLSLALGCGSLQGSASKDPMKCERDPNCAAKNSRAKDCSMQCSDNIECMRNCEEIQGHR